MIAKIPIEEVDEFIYENEIFDEGCDWVIIDDDKVSIEDIYDEDFYIEPTSWKAWVPEVNLWFREGVAMQRYEDGEMMADFDVTIYFDEYENVLYWEQDPPHVALYNFLGSGLYKNYEIELHYT